jgi:hypothetical protein
MLDSVAPECCWDEGPNLPDLAVVTNGKLDQPYWTHNPTTETGTTVKGFITEHLKKPTSNNSDKSATKPYIRMRMTEL